MTWVSIWYCNHRLHPYLPGRQTKLGDRPLEPDNRQTGLESTSSQGNTAYNRAGDSQEISMPAEPSRPFRQYRINSACTREGGGEEGHVKNIGNGGAAARSASALLLEEGLGGQRAAIPVCFRPPVAGGGGVLCFYHRGSCSSPESQPLHLYRRWQYLECRSARDEHFQHSHVCKGSYSTFDFGSCFHWVWNLG